MALADRVDELVRGLPRDWEHARIDLTVDEEADADRAALLLASASPGRAGRSFTFHLAATDHGSGTPPALARRVLARLDQAGIPGRVRLVEFERPAPTASAPAPEAEKRATLSASWDSLLRRLPPDWSDLYAEVELDSSDYLDRGALLLAPINPARAGGPSTFRFRAANKQGYGVAAGMARRAFQRLDDEGVSGRVRVLRVLSDTNAPFSQGPVWREDGRAV